MASDGTVTIWANEFDFGSFDNCTEETDLRFSIVATGQTPVSPNEFDFGSQSSLTFLCSEFSNFRELDVWVWDEVGNGDFCSVGILISDNGETCPEEEPQAGSRAMIAGQIETSYGMPIDNVRMRLSTAELLEYPKTSCTTEDGQYALENNPLGFNYTIDAEKDDNYANGLSTLDLVFISRHIIALESFDDPYKIIGSDATWDGRVSAVDLTELRRIILGTETALSNISPWVFIDGNQSFLDNTNPWPFVEQVDITNLDEDKMTEDFVAIKMGDVNESYDAAESRSVGELKFNINNQYVLALSLIHI